VRGVNANLRSTAAVLWAQPVTDRFHARFAAQARHYTYLLLDRPQRPGSPRGRVGWYHRPLDVDAMREGAAALPGMHDFSAFRAAGVPGEVTREDARAARHHAHGGPRAARSLGNGFLHHMVRYIVGALVYVGAGRQPARGSPSCSRAVIARAPRRRSQPDGALFAPAGTTTLVHGLPATRRPLPLTT
jgi:tRNA pseudouridine38-40 synthase